MICNNYHWHTSLSQQRHGTFVFLLPMPTRLSTEMWGKLVNISINIAAERSRVGSITSRCSGKWARTQDRTRETDQDRTRETAEIEPRSRGETKKTEAIYRGIQPIDACSLARVPREFPSLQPFGDSKFSFGKRFKFRFSPIPLCWNGEQ